MTREEIARKQIWDGGFALLGIIEKYNYNPELYGGIPDFNYVLGFFDAIAESRFDSMFYFNFNPTWCQR